MGSLSLQQIRKSFGATDVLKGIDLEVGDGEFCVFVGPSGCGKSTLLRIIAGLEDTSSGAVMIDGTRVENTAPAQRGIAMVFQSYALYPHMDVSKNMGFSLLLKKAQKSTIDARVDGAAKRLGLDTFLQRLPRQLSGGQRQRVAMGRAIVRDPKVFLFDEPLSNLDAKLRVHMRAEIKALHQQLKTTSVYVTHDQIEAMTMADRIVVMHDGLIQQVGAPLDLYDRPANMFVAGFIGSPGMNFLPATVEKAGKVDAVLSDGQKLRLPDGLPLKDGDAITIGLRPEHIRLADDGALRGEVVVVEPLGLSTQFYVKLANQQLCVFAMGRAGVKPGDTVRLAADPAALHLFDPKSGDRIG